MLFDNRKTQVIEVEVMQEDIDTAGSSCDSQRCAVANALNRQTGGVWTVGVNSAGMSTGIGWTTFHHDGSAIVRAFDSGRPITGTIRVWREAR
jgi:phage-related tail fiber protein